MPDPEFIELLKQATKKAVNEYEDILNERQECLRSIVKTIREIDLLNLILEHYGEEKVDYKKDK